MQGSGLVGEEGWQGTGDDESRLGIAGGGGLWRRLQVIKCAAALIACRLTIYVSLVEYLLFVDNIDGNPFRVSRTRKPANLLTGRTSRRHEIVSQINTLKVKLKSK